MKHKYGALPYGRLHRDMLQIAVENDFSKTAHLFYNWLIVNANPYSGEIYGNPSATEVADTLKTTKPSLYTFRDMFVDLQIIRQEENAQSLKCVVNHVNIARAELKAREALRAQGDEDEEDHPYANLVAGRIPREFVRIAAEKKLGKFPQRHFWYISLNIAHQGHLTRNDEIEDIGKIIGTNSNLTMLRSFKALQKTEVFTIKRPSSIQGHCQLIVNADAEADEQRAARERQKAYKHAMGFFLRRQEKIYGQKRKQPGECPPKPHANHVKEMKAAFRRHYEETGEFLTEYF